MIFSGSRANPFSRRVAATSWVWSTRNPFSADFFSTAATASSKDFCVLTVFSNVFTDVSFRRFDGFFLDLLCWPDRPRISLRTDFAKSLESCL
jgi:hypothetical protein